MIDLHCHTVASDGELTPVELIDLALSKDLSAIAITDHDTVASVSTALDYASDKSIEIVSGVELSCAVPVPGIDSIDVQGLFIDHTNENLHALILQNNQQRERNKREVISKLRDLGYEITYDEVRITAQGTFGRPHIVRYILSKNPDTFSSYEEVSDALFKKGRPAYVQMEEKISIINAISTIHAANGIAILAHPGLYDMDQIASIIDIFIKNSGDGIETYYPYYIINPGLNLDQQANNELVDHFHRTAISKKVLESGGNDYHGAFRPILGLIKVPDSVLENLKSRTPPT